MESEDASEWKAPSTLNPQPSTFPMTTTVQNEQITDAQMACYAELIYDRTGIRVSPQKKVLLSTRLRRRLKATGINSYASYIKYLSELPADDSEWDAFLQEITTHETYLFRNQEHWDWFRDSYLLQISKDASSGKRQKHLRIWSAACSTGDEVYTIAACIADRLLNSTQWEIDILGTDIGVGALQLARAAKFGKRAMHLVPESYRTRFFTKPNGKDIDIDEGVWTAKSPLTDWARFRQHNLLDPLDESAFDVIFLKNVFIYFDAISKEKAMKHILAALSPGGILVTGAVDCISTRLKNMERVANGIYRKSGDEGSR